MSGWLFLTNHALVLNHVAKHPDSTAREMAAAVSVTERTVHNVLSDLETAGYISRHRVGRRNSYSVSMGKRMRHPTQRDVAVGDLLAVLAPHPTRASARDGSDRAAVAPAGRARAAAVKSTAQVG